VLAGVYLSLGQKDKALELLEQAYRLHSGYFIIINYDLVFDDLRSDPRFQALMKKIGFPEAE
jgi:hypothetical protein